MHLGKISLGHSSIGSKEMFTCSRPQGENALIETSSCWLKQPYLEWGEGRQYSRLSRKHFPLSTFHNLRLWPNTPPTFHHKVRKRHAAWWERWVNQLLVGKLNNSNLPFWYTSWRCWLILVLRDLHSSRKALSALQFVFWLLLRTPCLE